MEPEAPYTPPEQDLELRPRLKVKRLNRLAVLLVALVAILVLWAAYFVLSSRPRFGSADHAAKPQPLEQRGLAIDRLQESALSNGKAVEPVRLPPKRLVPPTPPPRVEPVRRVPRRAVVATDDRLERAYKAEVLVPAFERFSAASRARSVQGSAGPAAEGSHEQLANATGSPDSPQREQETFHLDSAIEAPRSPFEIKQGSLIPAILMTGINSDLPGQTQALVRQNVYDTIAGRYLLIPQGSRLIGEYDSRIAWGQKRVLLAWNRLIFPDGRSLDLGTMPGTDLAAMAGVRDKVNSHFVRTFGSALLLSAITAGVQLSQPQQSADGRAPSATQIASAALGQEIGRVTAEITRRNIDIQPTLEIRPGYLFNVEVIADLTLQPPIRQSYLEPQATP